MLTRGGPIIWPLRNISPADVPALQAGLRPARLFHPVFVQQRPRWTNGLLAPKVPTNLPWNVVGLPSLIDTAVLEPKVVHSTLPIPPTYFRLTGISRDQFGEPLGNCVVKWFNTADDTKIDATTSDANGLYEFRTAGQPPNAYYLVFYKAGEPDRAGTTVNTLVGT